MKKLSSQELIETLIEKSKWTNFLRRFIDVLKINIFMIDQGGQVFIPPRKNGGGMYGSKFLTTSFGFNFLAKDSKILDKFEQQGGEYLEYKDAFDFHIFAVPVRVEGKVIANMIVGPVILDKRQASEDYAKIANQLSLKTHDLMDVVYEIRVVSFVTIKAILDLLSEVIKDILELSLEKKQLHQTRFKKDIYPKDVAKVAQDLYEEIHLDELLVTILDIALNLTQAECGSIMVLDEQEKRLEVKVSRGIDEKKVSRMSPKLGEGIAGIAANENKTFVISGTQCDNRIKNLLKRPDIKQSVIIPLLSKNRVFGVLNLHTKSGDRVIEASEKTLGNLSKLISTAIHSI